MNTNNIIAIVLAVVQIPSFMCAVQILLRFAQKNSPLRSLQNHLLICLLIVSVWTITIDISFTQVYLWTGFVLIQTPWACICYNISYLTMTALNRVLMAFMTIERHFLVFRPQLYRTHRSRCLIHYLPIVLIILFIVIYFVVTNAFVSCSILHFDYSRYMCGYTCTLLAPNFGVFFAWMHVFCPTMITVVASVLLPVRFVLQKRSLQRLEWHRARKMIIQTSTIAGAYTICWLSFTIILQLTLNNIISIYNPNLSQFFVYGPYATSLLTPFIVLHTVPGWMSPVMVEKIKRRLFSQHQNIVHPHPTIAALQIKRLEPRQRKHIKNDEK
jgi:hypothetical protein